MAYDYDIINSYYCSKCGTQVSGNETYCPVCGNRIDTYMYTPPPEPQPPVIQYYPPQYQAPPKVPYFGVGRAIAIIGSLLVIAAMFLPSVNI